MTTSLKPCMNSKDITQLYDYLRIPIPQDNEKIDIPILKISKDVENEQISRLNDIKKIRDNKSVKLKLENIEKACKTNENLVPIIIEAVLEYATLGEIVESMKNVFGEWTESSVI